MLWKALIILALGCTISIGMRLDDCSKSPDLFYELIKMSTGIDITELNLFPKTNEDMGRRQKLFKFTCNQELYREVEGKKLLIPDQFGGLVDIRNKHFENQSTISDSMKSIMDSENRGVFQSKLLSTIGKNVVSKMGPYGKVAGKALETINIFIPPRPGSVKQFENLVVSKKATVTTFTETNLLEVEFHDIHHLELDPYFHEEVQKLPPDFEKDQQAYLYFIAKYGTHFIRKMQLGGKIVAKVHYSLDSNSEKSKNEIKQIANLYGPAYSKKHGKESASSSFAESIEFDVYGGVSHLIQPPIDTRKLSAWERTIHSNPYAISVQLSLLSDIIKDKKISEQLLKATIFYINQQSMSRFKQMIDTVRPKEVTDDYFKRPLPTKPPLVKAWIDIDQQFFKSNSVDDILALPFDKIQKQIDDYLGRKANLEYLPVYNSTYQEFYTAIWNVHLAWKVYTACSYYYVNVKPVAEFCDNYKHTLEPFWNGVEKRLKIFNVTSEPMVDIAKSEVIRMKDIIRTYPVTQWQMNDCHHLALFHRSSCHKCKERWLDFYGGPGTEYHKLGYFSVNL